MGIYGDWAEKWLKIGITPIPVDGKKAFLTNWQNLKDADESEIDSLATKYSSYNIGIITGSYAGLVGFDLDYDLKPFDPEKSKLSKEEYEILQSQFLKEVDQIKNEITKLLPHTPCVKVGQEGKATYFYRPKGEFQSIQIDRFGLRLIDVLFDGKQCVMPPSIHPDTKRPYKWINGDLFKHYDDLPELDWDLVIKIKDIYEKNISELLGSKRSGTTLSGRNDLLKKSAWGFFSRGLTPDAVATHLIEIDKDKNSPPLFSDKKEFPRLSPEKAAEKFSKSIYKSFKNTATKPPIPKGGGEKTKNYEQIGFYFRYSIPKDDGGVKLVDVPQYELMADYCFDQKNMCFDDATSLKYDGKKWEWLTKTAFQNFIQRENKSVIKPFHMDNFAKMIKSKCFINAMGIDQPEAMINVANGIINVKTGELIPHTYQYMFKYCSPVDFISSAECPMWNKFLLEVFENNLELIDLAQRLFGYILIGGRPFLHKAFCLVGGGRNGKSTFLDVLRAVVGSGSYSTVSMSKLDKEFSLVNIDGKLANIVEESPTDEINAEVFKTLVGGGEIQAAHKGFDEYTFRCNARFVFACNDMPVFRDKSVGLEERLVFMPFNRFFAEHERDTEMTEKLLTELPGIFNWALHGAKTILSERKIPIYEVTTAAKEDYKIQTDPLYAWFKEEIEVTQNGDEVLMGQVFLKYQHDMEKNGNRPYSRDRFQKQFRKMIAQECSSKRVFYDPKLRDKSGDFAMFNVFKYRKKSPEGPVNDFFKPSVKYPNIYD